MKFAVHLFLFFFLSIKTVQAQYDIDLKYSAEKLIGFNFYTYGGMLGGFIFKSTQSKLTNSLKPKPNLYSLYVELVQVKHPQEVRYPGSNFIFAKENYLFSLRPGVSKDFILFTPAREEGVQLNFTAGGGLSIGMIKPYYIRYNYSANQINANIKEEAFDRNIHFNPIKIVGRGGFLNGLPDSRFTPGFHLKSGVIFYFGKFGKRLTGVEAGGIIEGFFTSGQDRLIELNRINLLSSAKHRWLFSALYLNIFYAWRK